MPKPLKHDIYGLETMKLIAERKILALVFLTTEMTRISFLFLFMIFNPRTMIRVKDRNVKKNFYFFLVLPVFMTRMNCSGIFYEMIVYCCLY